MTLPGALERDLAEARRGLLGAGLTRIAVIQDIDVPADWNSEWGRGTRLAWGAAKSIGRGISRLSGAPKIDLRHQEANGVLELAERRYTLLHPFMAQLGAGGTCWTGGPGAALTDDLVDDVGFGQPDPLWFTDLLLGVHSATAVVSGSVRGTECRHLTAAVDLHRVAAASTGPVWVPERANYRELAALPIAIWLDNAGGIRRIRFFTGKDSSRSLELWDHGSSENSVDWTRLPGESPPRAADRSGNGRT